jgi:hypothetical protein
MQPLPANQAGEARVATATPRQSVISGIDCPAMEAPGTVCLTVLERPVAPAADRKGSVVSLRLGGCVIAQSVRPSPSSTTISSN